MWSSARALRTGLQYLISVAVVLLVATACFAARGLIGYRVTALVLLMAVSVLAMLFEIAPVLTAAALSALVWNFFFIPPVLTFHIGNPEDLLLFLLYFVIALVNAVLLRKVRQAELRARDREQQEKAIAMYNTLLNSLSHELRTPISAIVGAVDAMKEEGAQLSTAQRAELLSTMEEAGMRLDRQVEDLLNMSRLESGVLQPRRDWCDVNELIGDVVNKLGANDAHPIHFTPDPGLPLFKLDGGLLEQVVGNVLHNALQYTPDGTPITLGARHEGEACVITVADEGPGFPEAERARAFDKFYRVAGTRRGGSGLGLSIVKGFVEAHGGTVMLAPNSPRGARFTISLPAETSYLSNLGHD